MKASVVMATYNGEKYIKEQIESIYYQTRQADEVLICDDGSEDNTVDIIEQFIQEHDVGNNWSIMINTQNKGCTRNFLDGVKIANGDIIFYCDQDDIWEKSKIEKMLCGFQTYKDMLACYCLRNYINESNEKLTIHFEFMTNVNVRSKGFQKISIIEAIKFNQSPGLCLAVRKSLIMEIRDFILDNKLTHDLPIGTIAAILGGYYVINEKLVNYRQHGTNLSSPRISLSSRLHHINSQIDGRLIRYNQMKAIYAKYKGQLSPQMQSSFKEAIDITEKSIEFLQKKSLIGLFAIIFKKNKMINLWISVNNFLLCFREKYRIK